MDFTDPPLNEVVFSVQFEREVIDEVAVLSEFWPVIRGEFPNHERQPPLLPVAEQFDVPAFPQPPQVELLPGPPTQRYWFLSPDATKIVQVQGDRFLFNWRQVTGDETYPRFETLCPEFVRHLEAFLAVLKEHHEDVPPITWCELSYINPIPAEGDTPGTHGQLARILNFLEVDPQREAIPPVEDTQLQQRFRITDVGGSEPIGRMYLTAVPGLAREDHKAVYVITLLARGRPAIGSPPDSVLGFISRAHDLIVRGFKEITTDEMHQKWGLE